MLSDVELGQTCEQQARGEPFSVEGCYLIAHAESRLFPVRSTGSALAVTEREE